MLAACQQLYGTPEHYLDPNHPVQRDIVQLLEQFGQITSVTDSCGAPCFVSNLRDFSFKLGKV